MLSTMQDAPLSLAQLLRYGSTVQSASTVSTWTGSESRTEDYAAVGRRAAQLAHALRRLGVAGDERVATFMWNNNEHLEAYLAVPAMGAVLHTLNVRLFPDQLTFIANPDEEVASPTSTPHIRAAAADADVALVLECGRANGNIVSARKGIADLEIVVHGRAAHAGIEPEKGRHAILEAARLVRELQDLNGRWPGVTFNVGTIRGGTRPNVIP